MHNILDKKPEKLKEYSEIEIEDGNLEYLIGLDFCAYRMPCKTVLGDRSYNLTKKRYESKKAMLDVYKEAVGLQIEGGKSESKASIFDLQKEKEKDEVEGIGLENSVE